jgi:hypothetical protein
MWSAVLLSQGDGQGQTGDQKENFTEDQQSSRTTLTPNRLLPVPFGSFLSLLHVGVGFQLPKVRQFLSGSPDIESGENGRKNSQTIENNRQQSGGLTEDRSAMSSVAAEHDNSCRAIDDDEALHQHPVGSSRLPGLLMAAFTRQISIRALQQFIIHRIKPPLGDFPSGTWKALPPDLPVFPFGRLGFSLSWRRRESLWHFSIRAWRYTRTRNAAL